MTSQNPFSIKQNTGSSENENAMHIDNPRSEQTSILNSADLLLQPPPGDRGQQQVFIAGGQNPGNPIFAVLKATAIQQAIGHPITYARILIQIGYEPLPAYRAKTFFGKEALFYPNVFRYLKHIHSKDGFIGLYRGFGCALLSKLICWYTAIKIDEILGPADPIISNPNIKPTLNQFIKKTLREVNCQSWGILLSHPFQVMAVRCMGQFIGRENAYSSVNIFQNFQEIYNRQGIGGFFIGLMPRWLLEVSTIVISNFLIHVFKTQLPTQNEMIPLYEYIASFVCQTLTYPLSVITTVTSINRCGLRAGTLPIMPIYTDWQDAYYKLNRTEQLKRGSSLFNRVALSPYGTSFSNA